MEERKMNERQKKTYLIHMIISIVVLIITVCLIAFILKAIESMNDPRDIFITLGLVFGIYAMYLIVSTVRVLAICKRPPIVNTMAITIILAYIAYYHMRSFCDEKAYELLTIEHIETALQDIIEQNCVEYKNATGSQTCLTTFDIVKQENPHCFEQDKKYRWDCYGNITITDMRFKAYDGYYRIYSTVRPKNDLSKVILGYIFSNVYYEISSRIGWQQNGYYFLKIPCKTDR
jgi:hypothetical protein